jgi:hypothetical protein
MLIFIQGVLDSAILNKHKKTVFFPTAQQTYILRANVITWDGIQRLPEKKERCSSMQLVMFTGTTSATGSTFADYVRSDTIYYYYYYY